MKKPANQHKAAPPSHQNTFNSKPNLLGDADEWGRRGGEGM
ncbi:MAG: hypothetical protein ACQCN4_02630 [Candidatus Bathyarchaeia archaeon]